MSRYRQFPFTDPEGVQGVVLAASRFVGEDREKLIRLPDGREAMVPRDLLQPQNDNSYLLTVPVSRVFGSEAGDTERVSRPGAAADGLANSRTSGADHRLASYDSTANTEPVHAGEVERAVIPAIDEQLVVTSQPVETGRIRIHKRVDETEAVIDEPLLEDNWDVQRVPVNRILPDGTVPEPRHEGDTLVLPVLEEVLVVEKRLILREEMRVTRRRSERHEPQTHRVRSEHLEVERVR